MTTPDLAALRALVEAVERELRWHESHPFCAVAIALPAAREALERVAGELSKRGDATLSGVFTRLDDLEDNIRRERLRAARLESVVAGEHAERRRLEAIVEEKHLHLDHSQARLARLEEALEESVQLQGHYASILNYNDGGQRIIFRNAEDWLIRLAMSPEERSRDAVDRRFLEGRDE